MFSIARQTLTSGQKAVHVQARTTFWRKNDASLIPHYSPSLLAAMTWNIPLPAAAFQILEEPSNALSLPTWAIHISSVSEWVLAMMLMWTFADVTGRQYWKGMTWAMMPSLGSAMCACTWHFFYNAPSLEAGLTLFGNFTLFWGAYYVYKKSETTEAA